MALWMEYIACLGLRPTSRNYGKSTVSDKPACRGGMRCVPDSRAVFSGAFPVPAMGLAAQQLCVCSVHSKDGVLGLPLPWSSLLQVCRVVR